MSYKDFFKSFGNCALEENQHPFDVFTIEEIYQMFKDRLIDELSVDVPGTSHYGVLVEDKILLQGINQVMEDI